MVKLAIHRNVALVFISVILVSTTLPFVYGCNANSNNGSSAGSSSSKSLDAVAYPDITIEAADVVRDFVNESNDALTIYETSNGDVIYDLDLSAKAVKSGQVAHYEEAADAGLSYILENGYPHKTYTNNKGMDAYITQMAIWWYQSEDTLNSGFKNAPEETDKYGLVPMTKRLVEEARQANSETDQANEKVALIYSTDDPSLARVVGLFDAS